MTTDLLLLNPNISANNGNYSIKTVRGAIKNLRSQFSLQETEINALLKTGLSQQEIKTYGILRSYVGTPYGPVYPTGKNSNTYHTDCVDLLWQYLFDAHQISLRQKSGSLLFDRNDKIYASHTTPINTLKYYDQAEQIKSKLAELKTGDIAFHGHNSSHGSAGISVLHAFILGRPILNQLGEVVDFTVINPRGNYSKDRALYSGVVVEGGNLKAPQHLQGQSLIQLLSDRSLWNKSGRPWRNTIFIGRPNSKN
jgi:hypothetical protein